MIDYHVHTDNSLDCKIPMVDMCRRAVAMGVVEIAFTDHFNNHMLDLDVGLYRADRYFADVDACRRAFPTLHILAGIEVGEPHRFWDRVAPVLARFPYDVVLGSLHWLGNESLFSVNYFRARPPEKAYGEYFREMARMAAHGGFDILAHMDLPKRLGYEVYGDFDAHAYEDTICPVWEACIAQNVTLEINTKGARLPVGQMHPTLDALRWYANMGGRRLTLGSDAHHPDSIAQDFGLAGRMAYEAGLKFVCNYRARRVVGWTPLFEG